VCTGKSAMSSESSAARATLPLTNCYEMGFGRLSPDSSARRSRPQCEQLKFIF
jgi:hypothetical protein